MLKGGFSSLSIWLIFDRIKNIFYSFKMGKSWLNSNSLASKTVFLCWSANIITASRASLAYNSLLPETFYRQDTETPPEPGKDMCIIEDSMYGAGMIDEATDTYRMNMSDYLQENGFYYFEVCAAGDGIQYTDSGYVMSDAFKYTGESAPALPVPTGLQWRLTTMEEGRVYYATWNNLDDYADTDSFNVCVYDKNGNYVTNNIWTKKLGYSRVYVIKLPIRTITLWL